MALFCLRSWGTLSQRKWFFNGFLGQTYKVDDDKGVCTITLRSLLVCCYCSIGFLMVFVVSGMKMISGGHPKHDSQGTLTWLCIHLHHHHLFISARENHRKTISFGLAYPKNVNKTTPKTSVAKKWLTDNKAWWKNRLLHYSFPPANDVFLLSGMNAVFMYITGYYSELPTERAGHDKQVSRFNKIP